MRLISPSGVRFSVSDQKGELLLSQGFKRAEAAVKAASAPAPSTAVTAPGSPSKRRTRSPKASTHNND